jgi:hypothetical protein
MRIGCICYVRSGVNRPAMVGRVCEVVSPPFLGRARGELAIGRRCRFNDGSTLTVEVACLLPITSGDTWIRQPEELSA